MFNVSDRRGRTVLAAAILALNLAVPALAQTTAAGSTAEESFTAIAYYGRAFDTFAPDALGDYPPGTATTTKNRALFGVDFDYRLVGQDSGAWRLWLGGETLHGVRSADISCVTEAEQASALCKAQAWVTPNGLQYATKILTQQTSLEAYVTPRLEFRRLQAGSSTPTWLYATTRLGFIALTSAPRVYKSFHAGVGLRVDGGPFEGTQLEAGWGNNELFSGPSWRRLKIDGLLTFSLDGVPLVRDRARFFVEMFIDNDLRGTSADSIQTFLGFDFDIRRFFGS
jgi:hypothetical protein